MTEKIHDETCCIIWLPKLFDKIASDINESLIMTSGNKIISDVKYSLGNILSIAGKKLIRNIILSYTISVPIVFVNESTSINEVTFDDIFLHSPKKITTTNTKMMNEMNETYVIDTAERQYYSCPTTQDIRTNCYTLLPVHINCIDDSNCIHYETVDKLKNRISFIRDKIKMKTRKQCIINGCIRCIGFKEQVPKCKTCFYDDHFRTCEKCIMNDFIENCIEMFDLRYVYGHKKAIEKIKKMSYNTLNKINNDINYRKGYEMRYIPHYSKYFGGGSNFICNNCAYVINKNVFQNREVKYGMEYVIAREIECEIIRRIMEYLDIVSYEQVGAF